MRRLRRAEWPIIVQVFTSILEEYRQQKARKREKLQALVSILYIELTRQYEPTLPVKSEQYMDKLLQFEDLLDANFKTLKLPSQYAEHLHMTERHLNRICKTCLNKTPSAMILDRSMLEAKRLLMQDRVVIADIAARLGYPDAGYFSRLFKKQSGKTPREFVRGYSR
jgi:AraC-like DNA-binding protein